MTLVAVQRRVAEVLPLPHSDTHVLVVFACRHEAIAKVGDYEPGQSAPCGWCGALRSDARR